MERILSEVEISNYIHGFYSEPGVLTPKKMEAIIALARQGMMSESEGIRIPKNWPKWAETVRLLFWSGKETRLDRTLFTEEADYSWLGIDIRYRPIEIEKTREEKCQDIFGAGWSKVCNSSISDDTINELLKVFNFYETKRLE